MLSSLPFVWFFEILNCIYIGASKVYFIRELTFEDDCSLSLLKTKRPYKIIFFLQGPKEFSVTLLKIQHPKNNWFHEPKGFRLMSSFFRVCVCASRGGSFFSRQTRRPRDSHNLTNPDILSYLFLKI